MRSARGICEPASEAKPSKLCATPSPKIDQTRVSGSRGDLGRGAFASGSEILLRLLQWRQDASILNKDAPVSRPVLRTGVISSRAILGGLHHHYVRV